MRIDLDELEEFVDQSLTTADSVATTIQLSENMQRYAKSAASAYLANVPRFLALPVGYGVETWATILFVDLRRSSKRAEQFGARATYLTMHTYLPAMAYVIAKAGGHVVGYRGDGLFAAFGLDENGENPEGQDAGEVVRAAVGCAKAMLETVDQVVEPALVRKEVPGDLQIGVGIDVSKVVVTRIGLREAAEVTAYGTSVNKAAHLSGDGSGEAVISARAKSLYPNSKGGKMAFKPHRKGRGLKIQFPSSYHVLRKMNTHAHK